MTSRRGIPWMQKGPYGLMAHWLRASAPASGEPIADWNAKVEAFDVDRLLDDVERSGAAWLIFTLGQNEGVYNTPNAYLETILPGRCSRRDLGGEVARACSERGIRFIGYLPTEVREQEAAVREAFGWRESATDTAIFQERYTAFLRAYAEHFGSHLHGWWFDGCYQCVRTGFTWNNQRFDLADWGAAARAGNPDAVIAMNPGANTMQAVSLQEEDYLGGEINDLSVKPGGPTLPLVGVPCVQWHGLTWLDCLWIHARPEPIPDPRFADEDLCRWVETCHMNGGGVTLNAGIYEDGSLSPATLEQLGRLKQHVSRLASPFVEDPE